MYFDIPVNLLPIIFIFLILLIVYSFSYDVSAINTIRQIDKIYSEIQELQRFSEKSEKLEYGRVDVSKAIIVREKRITKLKHKLARLG
ncbi:hypothetical protein [Roseibium sp. RKSG952]|uniref:hypothetical protein n=1 Tax=Roseibium sp. RKSG952 TaxID=2529384 RepID=UPI0012BCA4D2|nr:hypothetical protein [Roseibium sp. RKSG952]MTH94541.1 hypothetical protein [Roseibium sp. RKSG952]